MNIDEAIKQIRESPKRKFNQTIDLVATVKNVDLKKPENKFSKKVVLPHGRGKDVSVCVIGEKGQIKKIDIEDFEKNKSAAKKFSKQYDFYICEAPLMPLVGKVLGRYLAPRGKMPDILIPGKNPDAIIEELKKSVRIRLRDSPTIQVIIGTEQMSDAELKENTEKVMEEIKKAIPPKSHVKSAFLKTTMGKPVKIGV